MGKVLKRAESEKLFGKDEDLRTPIHDEIMMWLNNAVDLFLPKWIGVKRVWQNSELDVDKKCKRLDFELSDIPEKPNLRSIVKKWEFPITRGVNDILVAVPDMKVTYERPIAVICENCEFKKIRFEKFNAWFEVKSKIASLGEVVRQINIYKEYSSREAKWFLVSARTSDDFLKILNEQNIHFIEYDRDNIVQDECVVDGKVYKIPIPGLDEYVGVDKGV